MMTLKTLRNSPSMRRAQRARFKRHSAAFDELSLETAQHQEESDRIKRETDALGKAIDRKLDELEALLRVGAKDS